MNKPILAQKLIEYTGNRKDAEKILGMVLDLIRNTLKSGNKVVISNFGTLITKDRPPRYCHNPQSGEPIRLPSRRTVSFVASKKLLDQLQKNENPSSRQSPDSSETPPDNTSF